MATNDVNLQVINSMTQSQMQSLKDANGKIPSLANQIIMTDEEDVNLSQLRTEVVYDMTSSDPAKNWGYTSGITGNVIVSGKDFSRYDKLIIHATFENTTSGTGILDLSHKLSGTGTYRTKIISGTASNSFGYYYCFVRVDGAKTEFANGEIGYGVSGSVQAVYNNTYFISKIEGVLKTPSMIYTGKELFAGNGISIDDGVISSNLEMDLLWKNNSPTSYFGGQTITVANLSNYNTICVLYKSINASSVQSIGYAFGRNEINNGINLIFIEDSVAGRFVVVRSSTTIEFGEGYRGNSTMHNGFCIPVALYGLNIKIKE